MFPMSIRLIVRQMHITTSWRVLKMLMHADLWMTVKKGLGHSGGCEYYLFGVSLSQTYHTFSQFDKGKMKGHVKKLCSVWISLV